MATLTEKTLLGGDGGQSLLPRSVSDEIWKLATEEAIVPSLAKAHPVILGENLVPVLTKRPAASIIGEGQNKVDSSLEIGAKAIKPIKAVVGLEFTMETVHKNPAGVLDMISSELSDSLSRQIDLAVLHGRQASDGKPLSGNPEFLAQTTKKVALSGKTEAVDKELWDGYNQVVGGDKPLGFNGFALDPRLVGQLANARDKEGRRTNPDIPMGGSVATYSGQSVRVSRSVSGQVDASADTNIRGFGGDWTALRFGRALDIGLKRIEYGDPFGNGDLQRRNSVAFMTEVIFGWGILDLDAFVKYEVASTTSGATS